MLIINKNEQAVKPGRNTGNTVFYITVMFPMSNVAKYCGKPLK
jgi:hypothetical protein